MSGKRYEWTSSRQRALFDLIIDGATVEDAAALIGTTGRTAQRQAHRDAAFGAALSAAIAEREAMRERVGCGTVTRYSAGCRCLLCRDAHRDSKRRLRASKVGKPIPAGVAHGSYSTYRNWLCRCGPCTAAHSQECKAYYHARRAAQT